MKIHFMTICISLLLLQGTASHAGSFTNRYSVLTLTDGNSYSNARPQRISGENLVLFHSRGIASVSIAKLPDNVLADIGRPTRAEIARAKANQIKQDNSKRAIQSEQQRAKRAAAIKRFKETQLVLLDWRWNVSHGYITVEGQVGNATSTKLENVEAVARFYGDDGTFITSDSALVEYNPLMPQQISPFKVMQTHNPMIKRVSVEFKTMWGPQLMMITKEEYELATE